jgi:regulator of sirC expression with transglutaminase-like and TPR domain
MSFQIDFRMMLNCEDTDQQEIVTGGLIDYVEEQLSSGVPVERQIQALAEVILEMHEMINPEGEIVH